ncbi:MAG: hypothetical protein M3069_13575 [Chloroflexota bacterium]|nr:hypothetical protein [Chloroflexota bacterium]
MMVLLNGAAGGWDELAIAVVALGVLWLAVKLAGRKPSAHDDELTHEDLAGDDEHQHPTRPRD